MVLLQNSSSECIWTSASTKRSQTQPFLKSFFSWLHVFLSFPVIQISPHLRHLHLLLWITSLNWSCDWEEHPASTEKSAGVQKQSWWFLFFLLVEGALFISLPLLPSAGAMRFPLLFHTSAIADSLLRAQRATVSVWKEKSTLVIISAVVMAVTWSLLDATLLPLLHCAHPSR